MPLSDGGRFYAVCVSSPHIVSGMYHYRAGYFPKAGALELVFIVWFYTVMILSFLNFIRIYREATTTLLKRNMKLMFLAFVIAFFGSVEYLPNYGIPVFPVAFLPMFLFTTIMGYCVIRYRLMDIETVIHKTFMWFVTSAVAILPFEGLFTRLSDDEGLSPFAASLFSDGPFFFILLPSVSHG